MIPSKKLKPQITEFDSLLLGNYERVTLNKSNPQHYSYHSWDGFVEKNNKGVKSDQVYLYKLFGHKQGESNFSFVFDYMDKEENEHTVTVNFKPVHHDYSNSDNKSERFRQLKLNDNIVSSHSFSVNEFRKLISKVNNSLKETDNINSDFILGTIFKLFFDNRINFNKIVENSQKKYNKSLIF